MTLDEAIETTRSIKHTCRGLLPPDEQDALQLLIEAGKFVESLRSNIPYKLQHRLPGETGK